MWLPDLSIRAPPTIGVAVSFLSVRVPSKIVVMISCLSCFGGASTRGCISGEEYVFEEGCLSFPGIREDVVRPPKLKIKYYDENFNLQEEEFSGIIARVIQHEFDHTIGVFFIDKINPLRRILLKNRLNNIMKGDVDVKYKMKFAQTKKKLV